MSDPAAAVCPFCREVIAAGVQRCPHCGEHLLARRPAPARPESPRLKAAGALQLVFGALVALMVPCMGFGLIVQSALPPGQRQSVSGAVAALFIYVALAAFLFVTGVGAWKHRRWARPIMLSASFPAMVGGLIMSASMIAVFPAMMKMTLGMAGMAGGGGAAAPPPGFMNAVMVMSLGITGLMYVGIPGLFVGLYWSPDLRPLCEEIDTTPRWTDGIPIPVLGTSLWLGLIAACTFVIPAYGVTPLFGVLLTGWQTIPYTLALAAACAGLAVAVHRRHPAGWFGTLALVLLLGASHVVSFARIDMIELYRAMDLPPAQLEVIETLDLTPMNHAALGAGGTVILVMLAFLGYLRRFFRKA